MKLKVTKEERQEILRKREVKEQEKLAQQSKRESKKILSHLESILEKQRLQLLLDRIEETLEDRKLLPMHLWEIVKNLWDRNEIHSGTLQKKISEIFGKKEYPNFQHFLSYSIEVKKDRDEWKQERAPHPYVPPEPDRSGSPSGFVHPGNCGCISCTDMSR